MSTADGETVNCPTCDDKFDTERGMKIHHTRVHGESIAKTEVECSHCGATIRRQSSEVEDRQAYFCSTECESDWKSEHQTGEDNPNYSGGPAVLECRICGDEVEKYGSEVSEDRTFCSQSCMQVWRAQEYSGENHARWKGGDREADCEVCGTTVLRNQYQLDRSENIFCSKECHGQWKSEHQTGDANPSWNGGMVIVECSHCSAEFEKVPARVERSEEHFCNIECKGEWLSEHWTGENSPVWKGGWEEYYGDNWLEQRQRAIEQADGKCRNCGLTQDEHYDEYGTDLHVHHVVPFREFGDPEKANELTNLVVLCHSCHQEWEGLPVVGYTGEIVAD